MKGLPLHTISVVGAGRLASALTSAASAAGHSVCTVINRTIDPALRLSESLGIKDARLLGSPGSIIGEILLISVADDALALVDEQLAGGPTDWSGRTVLHTSGVHSSHILQGLHERGAVVGSFHPLQTFSGSLSTDIFSDVPVAVEGDEVAVRVGMGLASSIGASPFRISTNAKALYHAAAVTASNYLVTMLALADELHGFADSDSGSRPDLFRALATRTVTNVFDQGPEQALTGPVVRGDIDVIQRHLVAMGDRAPHMVPVYVALATETVRLAVTSGRLEARSASEMLDVMTSFLEKYPARDRG